MGGCLCGQVRYEFEGFSSGIANCHCSMCRRFSGAAYGTFGTVKYASFNWVCGENTVKTYNSSSKATRGFCSNCGSSQFYRLLGESSDYEIAMGALDKEPNIEVNANIYCASKAMWSAGYENLPKYDAGRA